MYLIHMDIKTLSKLAALISSGLLFLVSIIILYGWHGHHPLLLQINYDYMAVVYNAGLCYLTLSIIIVLTLFDLHLYVRLAGILFVLLISILTLLEYIFNINLGIDQLFFQHYISTQTNYPGRLPPNGAIGFALAAIAFILLNQRSTTKVLIYISLFIGFLLAFTGIFYFFGYVFNIHAVYSWHKTPPVALVGTIGFSILGISIFSVATYKSLIKHINFLPILPFLVFFCLFLGTLIYWNAINIPEYTVLTATNIPLLTLIFGFLISLALSTLVYFVIKLYSAGLNLNTETSRSKQALAINKSILESIGEGIVVVNLDRQVTAYNQKFLQMLSIPELIIINFNNIELRKYIATVVINAGFFFQKIEYLYQHPEEDTFDRVELTDGKILECLTKPHYLDNIIAGRVYSFRDITERDKMEKQIFFQATHDSVTSLPNRHLFFSSVAESINSLPPDKILSVVFLALDRIDDINQIYTHNAGDLLLKTIAEHLQNMVKTTDIIAHFDSGRFAILLNSLNSQEECIAYVKNFLRFFAEKLAVIYPQFSTLCNIGISLYPKHAIQADKLVICAESAMHKAKTKGRNTYQLYSANLADNYSKNIILEAELLPAIKNNQLSLHYQPFIDLNTNQINGVEALLRWQHPIYGFIPPEHFITIAEQAHLIGPVTEWVIRNSFKMLRKWLDQGGKNLRIAINFSSKQFLNDAIVSKIIALLNEFQINPHLLEIELTERSILLVNDNTINKLLALNKLGVTFSIDDFGTGYSNLSYLTRLPIEVIKIDKSFVHNLTPNNLKIVQAIIELAKKMHLKIIAEGIETEEQANFFKDNLCDEAQGYYFSKPIPEDDLFELLKINRYCP